MGARTASEQNNTMKIYPLQVTVTILDARMEGPSTAWAAVWAKVENPYGVSKAWVKYPLQPFGDRDPAAGEFLECGTAHKTIRGEVASCRRIDGGIEVDLVQPQFPYEGPAELPWGERIGDNLARVIRADRLGMDGRLVAMIDGALNSIRDGGDVAVTWVGNVPVQSTLAEGVMLWDDYMALREAKIPNGGPLHPAEEMARNLKYLAYGL
jgi:hypothetical protein